MQRVNPDDKLGLTLCDGLPVNQQKQLQQQQTKTTCCQGTVIVNTSDPETSNKRVAPQTANSPATAEDDASEPEDDVESEVFIQEIQSDSLAAADGRLRQGDILLQVRHQ